MFYNLYILFTTYLKAALFEFCIKQNINVYQKSAARYPVGLSLCYGL